MCGTGAAEIRLDTIVARYDTRARREGLHALHDWDGVADTVGETTIPIDVLTYMMGQHDAGPPDPRVLAMLVDYYFLHVLALLSLRIWDDGDPDDNLVLLDRVLGDLQGPDGSGQPLADDAATLLLIATCHYEPEEHGFDLLLDRVKTLSRPHQTQIALGHAASLGCHLRFGFEATYRKDTTAMRDDNVADGSTAIARTCDVMIHWSPAWNSMCRPRPTQPIFIGRRFRERRYARGRSTGDVPSRFSSTHLPHSTGDVRVASAVTARTLCPTQSATHVVGPLLTLAGSSELQPRHQRVDGPLRPSGQLGRSRQG